MDGQIHVGRWKDQYINRGMYKYMSGLTPSSSFEAIEEHNSKFVLNEYHYLTYSDQLNI